MRRQYRMLRWLCVFMLAVVGSLVVQSPVSASLETWSRTLDALNTPHVLTHPEGDASVGGASTSNPTAVQTVKADDSGVDEVPTGLNPAVAPDRHMWAVDADNTIYTIATAPVGWQVQTHVVAYRDGTKLWDVIPPDTCSNQLETVQALKLGADGNVHIVSYRSNGCSGQEFFLSALDKDDGSTISSVSLGSGFTVSPTTMFTYDDGVAVLSGSVNKIRHYNYLGVLVSQTDISLTSSEWVSGASADHRGRIYVTVDKDRSTTEDCPHPWTSVSNRVEVFDENGVVLDDEQQPIVYTVQPCAYVHTQASPNGVVMIVKSYGLDDRVVALDADMQGLWDAAFDKGTIAGRQFASWLGNDLQVDNNGNIVTLAWYTRDNQQYRGAQVKVLNGANGVQKSVLYTDRLDASVSFRVVMVGLSQGRIYIPAQVCPSYQCSGTDTAKLYAVPVAGMGMDYPRARVQGLAPTTQTSLEYVGIGDSFSAGLSVEPYGPPSDTNGCHRSQRAYVKLLDESPALNLSLQSFVACSGATTWNVQNGQNGEAAQLDALTTDTDIATITIGGNDADFSRFASKCVMDTQCEASNEYQETIDTIEHHLPGRLDGLFVEIKERIGPQTRILVVGYPRMMPYSMDEFPNCLYLSEDERVAVRTVTRGLNDALRGAATQAGSQFEFVDADANVNGVRISPFAGHELCSGETFFNGASFPVGYSYHPNAKGQAAYEELVKEWLLTHP